MGVGLFRLCFIYIVFCFGVLESSAKSTNEVSAEQYLLINPSFLPLFSVEESLDSTILSLTRAKTLLAQGDAEQAIEIFLKQKQQAEYEELIDLNIAYCQWALKDKALFDYFDRKVQNSSLSLYQGLLEAEVDLYLGKENISKSLLGLSNNRLDSFFYFFSFTQVQMAFGRIDSAIVALQKTKELAQKYYNLVTPLKVLEGSIIPLKDKSWLLNTEYASKSTPSPTMRDSNALLRQLYWNEANQEGAKGDFSAAKTYLSKYDSLVRYLYDKDKNSLITELEVKYKTKEKEILLTKEQSKAQLLLLASVFSIVAIVFLAFAFYTRQQKNKAVLAQKQTEYDLKVLNETLQAQELERAKISRALHDGVGANLGTLKFILHDKFPENNILGILDSTIHDIRKLSHDLSSSVLERLGLKEAIRNLIHLHNTSDALSIHYFFKSETNTKNQWFDLDVYRILQELLVNTLKHAEAEEVSISIVENDTSFRLSYEDDGKGFDRTESADGIGLDNIKKRLNKLKAVHSIESKPGDGFYFMMEFNRNEPES